MIKPPFCHQFTSDISGIKLPTKFTYPFYYEPHLLCKLAAKDVQNYLENSSIEHNFGLKENSDNIIGKMFGVLIVQNTEQNTFFLAAHSGDLQDKSESEYFVPSIADLGFIQNTKEAAKNKINIINEKLSILQTNSEFLNLKDELECLKKANELELSNFKEVMKEQKRKRKKIRVDSQPGFDDSELIKQSLHYKYLLNELKRKIESSSKTLNEKISVYQGQVDLLEKERKSTLVDLQKNELDQYQFINSKKEIKSLINIFQDFSKINPPAGTGNCSAPKLLQYAFKNDLKPIAMAEFWWGAPHKSELKRHKSFYPSCTSRCKPLLEHMLEGIEVEQNPLLINEAKELKIEIIFEDDYLLVINKPNSLLSVPGVTIKDSVATRLKGLYPEATGPLVVHRLDQETSGLMLIAKTNKIYKQIQKQFIDRSIKKKYIAILEGLIEPKTGQLDLPLIGDFHNRPYQLVCNTRGKESITNYKVLSTNKENTRIEFEPITGRTHQLRVHSAHIRGLDSPIKGDTLYGQKSDRLYLHASWISFRHPETNKSLEFNSAPNF